MQLQDLAAQLPDIARQVALPALVGGAGGGALAGYMSSKNRPANEDPAQRRRRILRNALVGVLLGGTAGATAPIGMKMLGGELIGKPQNVDPTGSALAFGARNALPLGVGAYGTHRVLKGIDQNKSKAMKMLASQLGGASIGGTRVKDVATLSQVLEGGGRAEVLKELARAGKGNSIQRMLSGHELLGEAGHKGNIVSQLLNRKSPGDYRGMFTPKVDVASAMAKHLGLSRVMPEATARQLITKHPGIAEFLMKHIRPNAGRTMGRWGFPAQIGAVGGATVLAKYLQDAAMGKN